VRFQDRALHDYASQARLHVQSKQAAKLQTSEQPRLRRLRSSSVASDTSFLDDLGAGA
jgi:hypothetical protein